jgi:hypothetical protein
MSQQPSADPDSSHYQQRDAVLTRIIMALPELLARCHEDKAAEIVAGLLKAHMSRATPNTEQTDDLDAIVNRLKAEEAAETQEEDY